MSDPKRELGPGKETGGTDKSSKSASAEPDRSPQGDEPGKGEFALTKLVVGVGASAGGLEAISELLRNLPSDTGMAFVLVQHLDPHHESILADLLGSYTRMPVLQVHGDVLVRPDHVYVIPPNATMVIVDGILRVSRPAQDLSYQRRPVDAFFASLAKNMRSRAIGVILSGAASDGTLGLKAIKAEGGITFAQNDTAKFDGMPRSAIAAGVVDFVLAPQRIAQELSALARHRISLSNAEKIFDDSAAMDEILAMVRRRTGVDFRLYKQTTIASERVIESARSGIYDEAAISTVSPERLHRFFTRSDSGYQINRDIRRMCVFSHHVLGVDPPLSRMDLISCRNLLIYFGAALQQRVIDTLAYALRPGGYLLVGPSENTSRLSEFFEPLDEGHRVYVKRPSVEPLALALIGEVTGPPEPAALLPPTLASETHPGKRSVHVAVDHMLVSHYGPSGIVVDKDFKIVEFRGNMNPYLHIPAGDAKLDLLNSVRDDLAVHLQSAILEAHQQNATIRLDEIQVRQDRAFHFVRITVIPVSIPPDERYSVILFESLSDSAERTGQPASSSAAVGDKRR